ncbi:MAG TPA: substrate-binding domain-containing protein [Solirubrobacterales bacterium]|nr:substrate-binding domain-containing protein [Solirubrobacterales bacterium]
MRFSAKVGALLGLLILVVIVAAGCGGGSSSSEASGSEASSSSEEGSGGGEALAEAEAAIKPYIGQANPPFPVDVPLKEAPSSSTKFSQLQFGTPFGAIIAELMDLAAQTSGVQINTAKAGSTASSIQSAADTMISQAPDAVLLPAAEPHVFATQLEEMVAKGIKIYSAGIMEPEEYDFSGAFFDHRQAELAGALMADWVFVKKGDSVNVVFYETPELAFSGVIKEGFEAEIGKICPECGFRTAVVKAEEIGSEAPNTVVSDLQANPDTEEAVFASEEAATGLPAALKAAQIEVGVTGYGAPPRRPRIHQKRRSRKHAHRRRRGPGVDQIRHGPARGAGDAADQGREARDLTDAVPDPEGHHV